MYNRYIPPPKEKRGNASEPVAYSLPSGFSSSKPYAHYIPRQATKEPDPPAPSQPQRIVFDDADPPAVDHSKNKRKKDEELTGAVESKKSKTSKSKRSKDQESEDGAAGHVKESKSRKRKRGETEQTDPPAQAVSEEKDAGEQQTKESHQDAALADGVSTPPPEPAAAADEERKPKREKKRKKKRDDNDRDDDDGDDGDEIRKRHKSVFEKVQKALQAKPDPGDATERSRVDGADNEPAEPEVEHGLEPLPQPEPVTIDQSRLTYETLPPWLASPIRVAPDTRRPFTELGISSESTKILESKGFKDAFAVQTAVLPLLMQSADRQGDVVVAAPTGSGKTLSYVLPMVHDISKARVTRLRALIVLPTRDLVQQVQQACEACAAASAVNGGKRVKIATAMGNRAFKEEQSVIMAEEQRYDPVGYERYLQKQNRLVSTEDSDDETDGCLDLQQSQPLPLHVIAHVSKVDVLICTPGRLVEHITKTRGFTLDYVRWLIVDEADKLLAQDFQQWLDTVTGKLSVRRPGARDFPASNKSGVRKVILSATMTRDLTLLNELKLSRPKLVVVEGTKAGEQSLPPLLREFAIKVREPSLKPLYLVDLLRSKHIAAVNQDATAGAADNRAGGSDTSDSDSSHSSGSGSDSDSDSESSPSSDDEAAPPPAATARSARTAAKHAGFPTTVLIFTKSNEAALRLSRLLALLAPDLAPLIGTLTSSTKTSRRARTLRAFAQGGSRALRILVASDLVSRGIDLLNLEHVVNYDLPISETSYVHRVGRTARAGRRGCAWTLVEHAEARRFWRDFAGEGKGAVTSIVRAGKVERVRIAGDGEKAGEDEFAEERVREYEAALARLRGEAVGR